MRNGERGKGRGGRRGRGKGTGERGKEWGGGQGTRDHGGGGERGKGEGRRGRGKGGGRGTCVGALQLLTHTAAHPASSRYRHRSTFIPQLFLTFRGMMRCWRVELVQHCINIRAVMSFTPHPEMFPFTLLPSHPFHNSATPVTRKMCLTLPLTPLHTSPVGSSTSVTVHLPMSHWHVAAVTRAFRVFEMDGMGLANITCRASGIRCTPGVSPRR